MHINWASIENEMRMLEFSKEFLGLNERPAVAACVVHEMNKCGSLAESMVSVMSCLSALLDDNDEDNDKESEGE